ncbi:hypothetical protein [Streptomyces sp. NPDC056323]|uniref:hypothetical protein n=1 Tax=unclassified Streptomyces TaxID=2593676 RepID=UPI0035D584BD
MSNQPEGRSLEAHEREEVAYICNQLNYIRTTLETYGAEGAAPLERILAALRHAEGLPSAHLEALHEALLAAGDAVGIHGHLRGLTLNGFDTPEPDAWVLLCPTGQCARYALPDRPDTPPCRINHRPLRKERL